MPDFRPRDPRSLRSSAFERLEAIMASAYRASLRSLSGKGAREDLQRQQYLAVIGLSFLLTAACSTAQPSVRQIFPNGNAAALAEAASRGDRQSVGILLADGAPLGVTGDRGVTLLQWMLLRRSLSGFGILLDAGADPLQPGMDGDTVMHWAAAANDPAYLSALLQRGVALDTPNSVSGRTPLMSAIMGGRARQFELLLKAGADPSQADAMGNTPLHIAAQINAPRLVLALLEAGGNPQARNGQGQTFQRYLAMGNPCILGQESRQALAGISSWLENGGVEVETYTGPHRATLKSGCR